MKEHELKIRGMSCHHCVMAVRKELEKIPGLEIKDVSIGSAVVAFDEDAVSSTQLKQAIEDAGYSVA
jgi:copper chaperone